MVKKTPNIRSLLEAVFLLLIFSLGFMQPEIEFRGISLNVTEAIFIAASCLWLVAFFLKQVKIRWNPIYILFGLYALGLFLSAAFSENSRTSFIKYLGELYLIGLAVLTFNVVDSERILKRVVFAWLAASTVTAFIGVVTVVMFYLGLESWVSAFALNGFGSLPPGNYPRIQSTFLYPAMLCNYLTVGLMILLAAYSVGWMRTLVCGILASAFLLVIAFTLTPGIGGVMLAVGIWYWFLFKGRVKPFIAKLSLFAGIAAAVGFWLVSTFTVISSPTSPFHFELAGVRIDPTQRLLTWINAGQTFQAHRVMGKGLGLPVAQVYFMPPSGQLQLLTDAHNFLLNVAAQAGLAGVVPLIMICVWFLSPRTYVRDDQNDTCAINLALWIAFLSAFIYQGLVGSFEDARHLWVLMGLLTATSIPNRP